GAALEIGHLLDKIGDGETGNRGVFGTALAIRVMAESARADLGFPAVRHDVGHRRMVAGIPIGGTEAVTDLCQSERAAASRKVFEAAIVWRDWHATRGIPRRSRGRRSAVRPDRQPISRHRRAAYEKERQAQKRGIAPHS